LLDREGAPLALESNAITLMRAHPDMSSLFALDEFRQRATLMRKPPWGRPGEKFPRPVSDADLGELLAWIQRQGVHLHGRSPVRTSLASVICDRVFHPVRDYLERLVWDRQPRLDRWLNYYLGVDPIDSYTGPAGRWWMISAVARIFKPGCTAKYVLIVEGSQDLGKSTALSILGGPWFTDDIASLGSKDSQMQVGNAWIIELAELDSTRRADISAVKAFISRQVDRFRRPYGEHIIEQPRQCVLAGTVNPAGPYLLDETGAVRFWPVTATSIDLSALRRDRDQLWAEAVSRYKAGERWWPDDGFNPRDAQEIRSETAAHDPWFDLVKEWLQRQTQSLFTAHEVLSGALDLPKERMDKIAERRIGAILRHLGYVSTTVRSDGTACRRWRRKSRDDLP
jgi:predicted P-loop ATPase